MRHLLGCCTVALALTTSALPAQTKPTFVLKSGAQEFPENFSKIDQLIELRDGRVLLIDSGESALMLVDMQRNTSSKISRKGGGPLEYQVPGRLLGSTADTVFYLDMMQDRFLLLSQAAKPLGTSHWGSRDRMEEMFSMVVPTDADGRGRLYGQTIGLRKPDPAAKRIEMPTLADTVEVRRLDRKSGSSSPITKILNPAASNKPKVAMNGGAIKMTMTAHSFHPSDVWTVLPDGRIAVLRGGVYQVQFIGDGGKVTTGPVIPYTAIPVTAAEKKGLVDSLRTDISRSMEESRKSVGSMAGPDGKAVTIPKMEVEVIEPAKWAANKPAYTAIRSTPDGFLWVTQSRPAGSRATRYDVLNATGALLAHIELAPGESLVGVGRGAVYTVRKDDDDLQYLKRYTLPTMK